MRPGDIDAHDVEDIVGILIDAASKRELMSHAVRTPMFTPSIIVSPATRTLDRCRLSIAVSARIVDTAAEPLNRRHDKYVKVIMAAILRRHFADIA